MSRSLKSNAYRETRAGRGRPLACLRAGWGSLLLVASLTACLAPAGATPVPPPTATSIPLDPQGVATAFLEAWKQNDYAGMYSLLSPLSRDAISPDDFKARYTEVARTATLQTLETQILSALKTGATAQVIYTLTLRTAIVGDIVRQIEMPLVYTENRWAVSWTEGLILPELTGGNTLVMDYSIPARANIYDRNGLGLALTAQNKAVRVYVQPGLIKDEPGLLAALAYLLEQPAETLRQKYASARADWQVPLGVLPAATARQFEMSLAAYGGVILKPYLTRDYPYGGVAPHVLGYLTNIPVEQLDSYLAQGYTGDERVGGAGLEKWGEPYLAGRRGGKLYVVTPGGEVAAQLAESQPQPAQAIYTTLDRPLQIAVQAALKGFRGSIVVLNPLTGEVLALASSPAYDPTVFEPGAIDTQALRAVLDDPETPLLNRATQGQYPPGSVFKIPVMAAALLSGEYTRASLYTCTGVWTLLGPGATKYDWTVAHHVSPHGKIDLVQALAASCDTYFYTVAYALHQYNPDFLPKVARQFGLGAYTQIEPLNEEAGLIPDANYKRTTYGEEWLPGDAVNMGIGQGYVLVTPLQIAQMLAAVRNGGTLYRPQIVQHIAAAGETPTYQWQPSVNGQLPVTAEQLAIIQEGLRGATTLPEGTAHFWFANFGIPVAGKTGTAENASGNGLPHAWFAGYTEANRADKPDLAIVVMLENQGEGSDYAAPLFRRILEIYYYGAPQSLLPWETEFSAATPTPE